MTSDDDRYVIGLETEEEIDWLARNRDEEDETDGGGGNEGEPDSEDAADKDE
jgi:hypothetical protein